MRQVVLLYVGRNDRIACGACKRGRVQLPLTAVVREILLRSKLVPHCEGCGVTEDGRHWTEVAK